MDGLPTGAKGACGSCGLRRAFALAGMCAVLILMFGCGEPSADEIVARIDPRSKTYGEDRAALIELGEEAIGPCLDRVTAESDSILAEQLLLEISIGEILKEIDPAAVLAEVDARLVGANHTERKALWGVVGMLGDEGAKQFAIKHLDSTSLETVGMAISVLGRYANEAKIRILLDEALGSPNREVRLSAALAISDRSAKAVPILEEAISNESNPLDMRMQLVYAVGESPFSEADASLKRLTTLRHKEVSDLAKNALNRRAERPSDRFR